MGKLNLLITFCALIISSLSAKDLYHIYALDTSDFEKSSAKSINQAGEIAGKVFDKQSSFDFIWDLNDGLKIIPSTADTKVYPKINNHGQVAGVIVQKSNSWWGGTKKSIYIFEKNQELKLLGLPYGWADKDVSIVAFNDQGKMIVANNYDPFKASQFAMWNGTKFLLFSEEEGLYICDMNNHSDYLITCDSTFIFGLFNNYLLQYKIFETKDFVTLSEGVLYYGLGINDNREVIARDKDFKKGYLWISEKEVVELDQFVPTCFNNHREMLGALPRQKSSEEMPATILLKGNNDKIDLRDVILSENFESFIGAHALNDAGQIVISAKVNGKEQALLLDPVE